MEKLICGDARLWPMDIDLNDSYLTVIRRLSPSDRKQLTREQNDWIMQRNSCLNVSDVNSCVIQVYRRRIARLRS